VPIARAPTEAIGFLTLDDLASARGHRAVSARLSARLRASEE